MSPAHPRQRADGGPASLLPPHTSWATCPRVAGQPGKNPSPPHSLLAQEGLGTGLLHARTQPRCGGHARTPVCPLVDLFPVRARRATAERPAAQGSCQGEGTGVALWAELGHLGASGSARPLANRRKAPGMRRAPGKGLRTEGFVSPVTGPSSFPTTRAGSFSD